MALGGIVLLAVATRLAAIGGRLHADDAYSWLVASRDSVAARAPRRSGHTDLRGERGPSSSLGRWLVLAVMLALAAAVAFVLRRGWPERSERCRRVILLVSATAGLTLLGHAAGALVGVDVFTQGYMTVLIPLAAVPAACALASVSRPRLVVVVSLVLVILGVAEVARRFRAEYEPDFTPVRAAATAAHARTVLTDSPIVLFYLHGLRPQYDRPFNLGPDRSESCARPCLVIDDLRVLGGSPRRVTGTRTMLSGRYVLTLER